MTKTIRIKTLELVNFKGVRDLKITFNGNVTEVRGRNGSGKTTIFDAFTYVLFGKDSRDRKEFNIKTLDADNKAIPRIPHEVKCVLDVNGEEVELCRRYSEKWTKKRGSAYEEFTGHEEERFYNGVPCSVKEYASKVSAICDETVFKFITNPCFFTGQRTDTQRTMLFRMAGGVSDREVAKGDPAFLALLDRLTGKSLDEYKREVAAKKRRIKDEVESIPARIDERNRDFSEEEDWGKLEDELAVKKEQLADIDRQLLDLSEAYRAKNAKKNALFQELTKVQYDRMSRKQEIESQLLKEYNEGLREISDIKSKLDYIERQKVSLRADIVASEAELAILGDKRNALLAEWRAIKAETLTFSEEEFTCPTCGRKYDMDEIESRQIEMTERFQQRKAARLEDNKAQGIANNQRILETEDRLSMLRGRMETLDLEAETLGKNPALSRQMEKPDTAEVVANDKTVIELTNRQTDIENQIDAIKDDFDTKDIQLGKSMLMEGIAELEKRLAKRDQNRRNAERVRELEDELRAQSQALAELEETEYTIAQFSKAKVNAIEDKVNSMFKIVRFKMFQQQLNGGETETCEAMVDGVPFSDLNNAGRINAGLDIINAICNFEGVYAPIFIDNAESVNELLATTSQTVRLIVTEDESLVIS